MDVAIIRDGEFSVAGVVSIVSQRFRGRVETLDAVFERGSSDAPIQIFCSSLLSNQQVRRVRKALEICGGEKLFVFPKRNAKSISRLKDLGFKDFFAPPLNGNALRSVITKCLNRRTEQSWADLDPATHTALKKSLATFETCFARARRGEPLPMEDIQLSAKYIRHATRLGSFNAWIDALAEHHNYSFRHCMFVAGSLTHFAHAIGLPGPDIQQLATGGLVHDIGKSAIPLRILDKTGKLSGAEWQLIRKHPTLSGQILRRGNALDAGTISAALDHHEKLDGTGYPNGLSGAEISDCARLTAIADVYSALIDIRPYRATMSSRQALDLMATFEGHLDMRLFDAFRDFASEAR